MSSIVKLPIYVIDAFTDKAFKGNPAAVCLESSLTENELSDSVRQKIAMEMNLSETAFIKFLSNSDSYSKSKKFSLRWFTPTSEVPLCGHATLASALVLFGCIGNENKEIEFETRSRGSVRVKREGKEKATESHNLELSLDFPSNPPGALPSALSINSNEIQGVLTAFTPSLVGMVKDIQISLGGQSVLMIRLTDEYGRAAFEAIKYDAAKLLSAHDGKQFCGVLLTCKGSTEGSISHAFYSRYFAPWVGVPEDPVTGSAHTVLTPYWFGQLGIKAGSQELRARQCSERGGELRVRLEHNDAGEERVKIIGNARLVLDAQMSFSMADFA